jgi:molecular chaperone DnaK (HSP70)
LRSKTEAVTRAARRIVGIDLGTTHTVVAWTEVAQGGAPQMFEVPELVSAGEIEARPLLPSALYAPPANESVADPWGDAPWVVGELARRRGQEVPGRLVASAKSWLSHAAVDRTAPILPWGTSEDSDVPRLSPVDASARVLAHVRRAYNEAFPADPLEAQQVMLTVPASFDQAARELTLRAAAAAGLSVRLLEEPQAAFYDYLAHAGAGALEALIDDGGRDALVLVCDVGGGTTDLSLIRVAHSDAGELELERVAVGRHLLLGGDNMDLALAHRCEARLIASPERLEPARFAALVLACRAAKERLLGGDARESEPITLLGAGSSLIGGALSTRLDRDEVEQVVLEGFFPPAARDAQTPSRARSGLVAFGLPYERDAAITRHIAAFFARHAGDARAPRALLLNGGVFRATRVAERIAEVIRSWGGPELAVLPDADPDLAVARGAVVYGLSLHGRGLRIGGGSPHGYYVGLDASGGASPRAVCVVPRGAREGERHLAQVPGLELKLGRPVRFELFASDDERVHAPGQIVGIEAERFVELPQVSASFDAEAGGTVGVALEGELSAVGTLELACVESATASPRRFRLAFELRGAEATAPRASTRPAPGVVHPRFAAGAEAVARVFGKGRGDVHAREVKDLWRELEKVLGERSSWSSELARALYDRVGAKVSARRRSPDHERVFWMLAGYCLRPGYGHALDAGRIQRLGPLFEQGVCFRDEARNWQQFWIAWRRVAGGLDEALQTRIRDRVDPFLAPPGAARKKPKGFLPQALDEMLEMAASLERVQTERRAELGRMILERTWTDRNPRLWAAIGRIGARVPTYASLHHVVAPQVVERWLDHLLREKWQEVPTAAQAAAQLARVTGDRARDVSETFRDEVARQLERSGASAEWVRAVRELVPIKEAERAEFFGESLPVGLHLSEGA